jgi:hypothetical protein
VDDGRLCPQKFPIEKIALNSFEISLLNLYSIAMPDLLELYRV